MNSSIRSVGLSALSLLLVSGAFGCGDNSDAAVDSVDTTRAAVSNPPVWPLSYDETLDMWSAAMAYISSAEEVRRQEVPDASGGKGVTVWFRHEGVSKDDPDVKIEWSLHPDGTLWYANIRSRDAFGDVLFMQAHVQHISSEGVAYARVNTFYIYDPHGAPLDVPVTDPDYVAILSPLSGSESPLLKLPGVPENPQCGGFCALRQMAGGAWDYVTETVSNITSFVSTYMPSTTTLGTTVPPKRNLIQDVCEADGCVEGFKRIGKHSLDSFFACQMAGPMGPVLWPDAQNAEVGYAYAACADAAISVAAGGWKAAASTTASTVERSVLRELAEGVTSAEVKGVAKPFSARVVTAARELFFTTRAQVDRKFKHAIDFGIQGDKSAETLAAFEQALSEFVHHPKVKVIPGYFTDRAQTKIPVVGFVDEETGLVVMSRTPKAPVLDSTTGALVEGWDLEFFSAWKANEKQLEVVLAGGLMPTPE